MRPNSGEDWTAGRCLRSDGRWTAGLPSWHQLVPLAQHAVSLARVLFWVLGVQFPTVWHHHFSVQHGGGCVQSVANTAGYVYWRFPLFHTSLLLAALWLRPAFLVLPSAIVFCQKIKKMYWVLWVLWRKQGVQGPAPAVANILDQKFTSYQRWINLKARWGERVNK